METQTPSWDGNISILARKEIREAAELMGREEVRHLVRSYYQIQEFRKSAANMSRTLDEQHAPNILTCWIAETQEQIEKRFRLALGDYAKNQPTGEWMMSQHGVGPVIAAGLLAHIDISRAKTVSSIWRFAGLDPSIVWKKGEKRPFNADLKVLCWNAGASFVRSSASEKSFYGKIYRQRKELDVHRNRNGHYANLAAQTLLDKNIKDKKTREIYKLGKLPDGRVDLTARRVAVKLFLSHFHDVLTWHTYGHRAPAPYAFCHLNGHKDMIEPPNAPWPAGTPYKD